jgi:hypothetical protein
MHTWRAGHVECVELLLKSGANIRAECDGCPPLIMATCLSAMAASHATSLKLVQLLLAAGADVYSRYVALHQVQSGSLMCTCHLLPAPCQA